jgi:hypothetical protein
MLVLLLLLLLLNRGAAPAPAEGPHQGSRCLHLLTQSSLLLMLFLNLLLMCWNSSRPCNGIPAAAGCRQAGLWEQLLQGLLLHPTLAASCGPPTFPPAVTPVKAVCKG